MSTVSKLTIADLRQAAKRIRPYTHRTPVITSASLDREVGVSVFLKCENLQKVGAFKFRGAVNAVFSLSDEEAGRGVATHSSGNHAQALALAARLRGIDAYIVMPENATAVKVDAVKGYGGQITFCEPNQKSRENALSKVLDESGAVLIHPYDNEMVISGQGTAALELLDDYPELDLVIAPVGGGGLLSGTALAATGSSMHYRVIGAEPEMADDAYRSMQTGTIVPSVNPQTIADGLLTALGELTFPIIRDRVEQIVTVSEEAIIEGMRFIWERTKLIIEPSSAVPIGLLLEKKIDLSGLKAGVIISGGNVNLERLPWQ